MLPPIKGGGEQHIVVEADTLSGGNDNRCIFFDLVVLKVGLASALAAQDVSLVSLLA